MARPAFRGHRHTTGPLIFICTETGMLVKIFQSTRFVVFPQKRRQARQTSTQWLEYGLAVFYNSSRVGGGGRGCGGQTSGGLEGGSLVFQNASKRAGAVQTGLIVVAQAARCRAAASGGEGDGDGSAGGEADPNQISHETTKHMFFIWCVLRVLGTTAGVQGRTP